MSLSEDVLQRTPSKLPYALLLQKCGSQLRAAELDTASTIEPDNSSTTDTVSPSTPGSLNVPAKDDVTFLRNVSTNDSVADEMMANLISQTRSLSFQAFEEDCLLDITKRSGWRLTLLATTDLTMLCGFIITKNINGALVIKKVVVASECRGLGFGKLIMDEVTKTAKKQTDIFEVRLSSLSTAVTFYQRLGFKAHTGMKFEFAGDTEFTEGQVYMEKKLRPRPRRK